MNATLVASAARRNASARSRCSQTTNVYSLHGLLTAALLICCPARTFAVPRLRKCSCRRRALGARCKASVIGTRLHWQVSLSCALMAAYLIFVA